MAESRLRQRRLDQSSSARGATLRSTAGVPDFAALQKAAGNQAVTAMVQAIANGHSGNVVQRDVMEYVKDAYQHVKDRVKKKEPGAEDSGEDWEKPSEEAALHAREAFDLGAIVLKRVAGGAKAADPEGAAETLEYAEGFEKASELVEKGAGFFEKGVSTVRLTLAADKLYAAVNEVNSHDIRSDPEGSARAFDKLFAITGEFAEKISPKGPWQGYFELLKHFSDNGGFFANVSAAMRGEIGPQAEVLKQQEIDPKNERWQAEPTAAPAEKVPLGNLYDNVAAKVDRMRVADPGVVAILFDQFQNSYGAFYQAWDSYNQMGVGSWVTRHQAYEGAKAALVSATDNLIANLVGLQRHANDIGVAGVSFQPDIDTLTKVKK